MIKRLKADVPFLRAATVHGGIVYVSGQVALDSPGASVRAQSEEIFARIDEILQEAGSDKHHLLKADVWLTDISTVGDFNEVWMEWLGEGDIPARACVESKFANPDWYVEVAVVAVVKE